MGLGKKRWKIIAEYLRNTRIQNNKTQMNIARQACVHPQLIAKIELGQVSISFNIIRAYRDICIVDQEKKVLFDGVIGDFFKNWLTDELDQVKGGQSNEKKNGTASSDN